MKKRGLKFKILLIILIILTLQFLILFVNDSRALNKNLQDSVRNIIDFKCISFCNSIKEYEKIGNMYLNGLMANEEIINAFKEKDRERLIKLTKKSYDNLKKEGKVEQMQFHESPAKSFLRLHMPSKYGDDLSTFRKTVVTANKEKKEVSGIEIGVGDVGVRIVRPVFTEEGEHIGSVEYGGNINTKFIEEFLKNAADEIKKGGMNVTIVSKSLKGNFMLVGSNFEKELEKDVEDISKKLLKTERIVEIKGNNVETYTALKDYSNEIIGYIKINFEITELKKEYVNFFIKKLVIYFFTLIFIMI